MAVAPATVGRRQAVADLNTFRPTDRSVSSAVANHLTVHDDQPANAHHAADAEREVLEGAEALPQWRASRW